MLIWTTRPDISLHTASLHTEVVHGADYIYCRYVHTLLRPHPWPWSIRVEVIGPVDWLVRSHRHQWDPDMILVPDGPGERQHTVDPRADWTVEFFRYLLIGILFSVQRLIGLENRRFGRWKNGFVTDESSTEGEIVTSYLFCPFSSSLNWSSVMVMTIIITTIR